MSKVSAALAQYIKADRARSKALNRLREIVLSEYPIKVGDTVKLRGKKHGGRVTDIHFQLIEWTPGKPEIELALIVYPIMRNGRTASIGKVVFWNDTPLPQINY